MKCNKCGSDWNTKTELDTCPFCGANLKQEQDFTGTFEDVVSCFKYIFKTYGTEILTNKQKFLSLISDLLPAHESDIKLLRVVLDADIYTGFIGIDESQVEDKVLDAIMIITDRHFIAKQYAEKAVSWIVSALFEGYTPQAHAESAEVPEHKTATKKTASPKQNKSASPFPNGEYKGEVKDGKRHGFGIMTYTDYYSQTPNICRYEGDWKDDKYHGFGMAVFPDGTAYKGNWENGLRCGHGVLYSSDAFTVGAYNGHWLKDKYHGTGTLYSNKGVKTYEGEFKNGVFDGNGTIYYNSGKYIGNFSDGKRHGFGILLRNDGSVNYKGYWYKNNRCPDGIKFFFSSGQFPRVSGKDGEYRGEEANGKRHGHGALKYSAKDKNSRDMYVGEWQGNKRQGWGILTFTNGDKYEGEWYNDKYHGEGKYTKKSGKYFIAKWSNGKIVNIAYYNANGKCVSGLLGDFSFKLG